jgi:uncharacterized protein YqkB
MKEEQHIIRMLMPPGGKSRYIQQFVDVFVDDELKTRTLTCMSGGHTYMYIFTPETAWDCMEKAFDHALGDDLNLTLDDAEALSLTIEEITNGKGPIGL